MIDIYGGRHPAEVPVYTIAEAARIIRRPASTVWSWTRGAHYNTKSGRKFWSPIMPADPHDLSFQNLVELHVFSSLRSVYGVQFKNVRQAIEYLQETEGTEHPLANVGLITDRTDVFLEQADKYLNLSQDGQLEMKEQLASCMEQVDRGDGDLPLRWSIPDPKDKSIVIAEINPGIRFGRPRIPGTGIPTGLIYERNRDGETAEQLAEIYERPVPEVDRAIYYENWTRDRAA